MIYWCLVMFIYLFPQTLHYSLHDPWRSHIWSSFNISYIQFGLDLSSTELVKRSRVCLSVIFQLKDDSPKINWCQLKTNWTCQFPRNITFSTAVLITTFSNFFNFLSWLMINNRIFQKIWIHIPYSYPLGRKSINNNNSHVVKNTKRKRSMSTPPNNLNK